MWPSLLALLPRNSEDTKIDSEPLATSFLPLYCHPEPAPFGETISLYHRKPSMSFLTRGSWFIYSFHFNRGLELVLRPFFLLRRGCLAWNGRITRPANRLILGL